MILLCTMMQESLGSLYNKKVPFQEILVIIKLLYLDLRRSFLVEYRITLNAKRRLSMIQINVLGPNSSKLEIFQNLEMIIPYPKLMQIHSLFLEDSLQAQELMKLIYVPKMVQH